MNAATDLALGKSNGIVEDPAAQFCEQTSLGHREHTHARIVFQEAVGVGGELGGVAGVQLAQLLQQVCLAGISRLARGQVLLCWAHHYELVNSTWENRQDRERALWSLRQDGHCG